MQILLPFSWFVSRIFKFAINSEAMHHSVVQTSSREACGGVSKFREQHKKGIRET